MTEAHMTMHKDMTNYAGIEKRGRRSFFKKETSLPRQNKHLYEVVCLWEHNIRQMDLMDLLKVEVFF